MKTHFETFLQVFRHGERTPADTYPLDPYKNLLWEPFGWGQLTNASKYFMIIVHLESRLLILVLFQYCRDATVCPVSRIIAYMTRQN